MTCVMKILEGIISPVPTLSSIGLSGLDFPDFRVTLFDIVFSHFTSLASSALSRSYAKPSKRPDTRLQCYLAYDKSRSIELAKEDSLVTPRLVQR